MGGLLDRRVYHLPFSRTLEIGPDEAASIARIHEECTLNRGILLLQPEHLLSFKLMGIECLLTKKKVGQTLLNIQQSFDTRTRDIVDESDENFSPKFELIYTMGSQRPIDMSPERWNIIHSILGLVFRFAANIKTADPSSIEVDNRWSDRYPRVRILKDSANEELIERVGDHICKVGLPGLHGIARQHRKVRMAALQYITQPEPSPEVISAVENSSVWTESTKKAILLARGMLAGGILRFAFASKRWRVNYGLDLDRKPSSRLAVPYRSKDNPTLRSEFSHPDVVIVLTSLTYYYGGLSNQNLLDTFSHLLKSDQADIEYSEWIRTAARSIPAAYRKLSDVNLLDRSQCEDCLFPRLRYSKATIDYFLTHIVFPKEMREFPYKLSASGWDIGQVKSHPTTGFSGTSDSSHVLPLGVHHLDLPTQAHTSALVLSNILQDENSVQPLPPRAESTATDAEHLLNIVQSMDPPTRVILDVGAQILELDNREVAEKWLSISDPQLISAVVFFGDNEDILVLDRTGRVELFHISAYLRQLDVCLVYLDEAHTRGTDLKLPRDYRAAVTLGANLTKDRLVQACMRMRKLGKGQSVVFCVPEEIQNRIREMMMLGHKAADAPIEVADVLNWSISETWSDLRRSMPLWAAQGLRFEKHKHLLLHSHDTSEEQAEGFLEDEAQSIEQRYRPKPRSSSNDFEEPHFGSGLDTSSNATVGEIVTRCQEFEATNLFSTGLHEEQERELAPEIEEQRQVEKPPKMEAADHHLDPALIQLINTGVIHSSSPTFLPAFQQLSSTSAAAHFRNGDLSPFPTDLLVTRDFITTVKLPTAGEAAKADRNFISDSYHRPVQWILSVPHPHASPPSIQHLIIISPFEADILLPILRQQQQKQQQQQQPPPPPSKVTLHLYAPRRILSSKPLDSLDLYYFSSSSSSSSSSPPSFSPLSVPRSLTHQLNLFAGQLYLRSYTEYGQLCEFLGLASSASAAAADAPTSGEGGESEEEEGEKMETLVEEDGFERWRVGKWGFRESPVGFLNEFFVRVRREGGLGRSHMGRVLRGELLEEEGFEEV